MKRLKMEKEYVNYVKRALGSDKTITVYKRTLV